MEELNERVAKLETTIQEHDKRLDAQLEKNDTLTRLTTIMEVQAAEAKEREKRQDIRDEKQNEQIEKVTNTLNNINSNLTELNISQQQMKNDMSEIGKRVTDIEHNQVELKIDPVKMFKGIVKQVCLYAGGILVAYVLYKLGINAVHNG